MRPLSRIAIRSWTHSNGLSVPSCASRNPAQPPSRGCAANSSDKVGLGGTGRCHRSPSPLGSWTVFGRTASAAGDQGKACCHTTHNASVLLLFFFPRIRVESQCARLGDAFSEAAGVPRSSLRKASIVADDSGQRRPPQHGAHMIGVDLDRAVDLMVQPARGARRDDPVPARPERQRRHRRLAVGARKGRLVDVVTRDPLVKLADVGVGLVVAGKRRARASPPRAPSPDARCASSRANIPPRLQPTSSIGRPS